MERLPPSISESKHQYQSAQWSRLLQRKYPAEAPPNRPFSIVTTSSRALPQLNLIPSLLSSCLSNSHQAQSDNCNQLINQNKVTCLLSSPLPPLLSIYNTQAVSDSLFTTNKSSVKKTKKKSTQEGHGNRDSSSFRPDERMLIAELETAAKMPKKELGMPNLSQKRTMRIQPFNPDMSLNQQSNSVPSTPHQHLRKFSFESREPSPGATNSHSPRSAYSESNIILPSTRFTPRTGTCPYETALANIKRRMPYSLGSEKLEKLDQSSIKSSLLPDEERILSNDMKELYRKLLPSPECELRRAKLVSKLEKLFNDKWPGHNILVHVFGSSGNCLYTDHSDVDLCITTNKKEMEEVCIIADLLAKSGMQKVICVSTAKVPIVKIWDPELCLACDMNVNNTLALENTRMIKTYVQIDERVQPLAMIIKYWTKKRIVNDAAFGGTLSSYTWICMIINFLQSRDPPILPALHQQANVNLSSEKSDRSSFADDIETLRHFGHRNKETLGELLFSFFRFYAHEFDYDTLVISVRLGKQISKVEKGWHLTNNNRLCVEEPFNVSRNLGNTADDTSFRGLHIELRRAFDMISQAKLEECCEQWIFPPEERRIWEPATKAKVVLRSASTSRGGRGGTQRMNRYSNQQHRHHPNNNRRASSAAFEGNPLLVGQLPPNILPQDSWIHRQAQAQLQNELYSTYSALQAHENNLRFQMYAHGLHAQAYVQSQAQAQPQNTRILKAGAPEIPRNNSLEQQQSFAPPIRPEMYYYPHYPGNLVYKCQNTSKNLPSPSLGTAILEVRRSVHRSTITSIPGHVEPLTNSSLRSQSQPAIRSVQQEGLLHRTGLQAASLNTDQGYYRQGNDIAIPNFIANDTVDSMHRPNNISTEKPAAMEYVGYYVRDKFPSSISRINEVPLMIPTFGDMAQPKRRHSTDQMVPSIQNSLKHNSRSSSPICQDQPDPVTFQSNVVTKGPAIQNIQISNAKVASSCSPVINDSSPMPVSITSWQAHVKDVSGLDNSSQDFKTRPKDNSGHISYTPNQLLVHLEKSEQLVPNEIRSRVSNEQNTNLNGVVTMNTNNSITIAPNNSSPPKSLIPVSNKSLTSQSSPETLHKNHKRLVDYNRIRTKGLGQNGFQVPVDTKECTLNDDLPNLSPVYEAHSKSSRGNQISETRLDKKEKSNMNSLQEDRKSSSFNINRASAKVNNNCPLIPKRHNQGSKSEADGLGSWKQVPRGKKKTTSSISKGFMNGRGQSEKLPTNASERKGG